MRTEQYIDGQENQGLVVDLSAGSNQVSSDDDDWLSGREGSDLIDGGNGNDHVNFQNHSATTTGITVDLSNIVASGGYSLR